MLQIKQKIVKYNYAKSRNKKPKKKKIFFYKPRVLKVTYYLAKMTFYQVLELQE